MRIRFQADADLNQDIVTGTLLREPAIDFQTAGAAGIVGLSDSAVVEFAAREGRILVSHDKRTMTAHFKVFLARGGRSPGLLIVPQKADLGSVIETLILIWAASEPEEWEDGIDYIPFKR